MKSLAKQFANHTIERAYNAVVWGSPRAGNGVIEGDIGRSPFDRKRMAVLRGGGKAARTRYRLIESFGDPARPFASLIECRLETGRTHQIRVHLTHIGHPLIGDPSYGRARQAPRPKTEAEALAFTAASEFPRQALHALLLGFQHPTLHKTMHFESAWPADSQPWSRRCARCSRRVRTQLENDPPIAANSPDQCVTVPEFTLGSATCADTPLFSQHFADGPCTPGLTQEKAWHCRLAAQSARHIRPRSSLVSEPPMSIPGKFTPRWIPAGGSIGRATVRLPARLAFATLRAVAMSSLVVRGPSAVRWKIWFFWPLHSHEIRSALMVLARAAHVDEQYRTRLSPLLPMYEIV